MAKMKKQAALITLGTFFIVSVILSFVIMSYRYAKTSEDRFTELAVLDRTDDMFSSIELAIKDRFAASTSIRINETNVTLIDNLNNTNLFHFINNLTYFENFLESNLKEVNLSIGSYKLLLPNSMIYNHTDFGQGNITISPLNAQSYTITIRSPTINITAISESGGSAGTTIKIDYYDTEGILHQGLFDKTIVTLTLESGSGIIIYLSANEIKIWNKGNYQDASAEIRIEYSQAPDEVTLYGSSLAVNYAAFNVTKQGAIKLATS